MLVQRPRQLAAATLVGPATGTVLGVATVVLSILSIGLPGTAVLASGWALAAGLSRRVPGLDGPVSWAAAVLIEAAMITGESVALAFVSGHEHGWRANLAILCLPGIVGLVLLVGNPSRWRPGRTGTETTEATETTDDDTVDRPAGRIRVPSRPLLALAVTVAGLLVPIWIASHGVNYRIAWTMSGDSRNHVQLIRSLLSHGGLTVHVLTIYPAVIDALTSVIAGAGGRGGLTPGRLMTHDVQAGVTTYVVTGIALGTMVVATLLELLPPAVARMRRLPAGVAVLAVASSAVSTSALILGTSVQDGFISAYGTVPLVIAAVVVALRCCATPTPATFVLIGPAAVLVFLSFTLLAVIPLALVVVCAGAAAWTGRALLRPSSLRLALRTRLGLGWLAATLVSGVSLLSCVVVTVTQQDTLHSQFLKGGSVTSPNVDLLWVFAFLAVAAAAFAAPGIARRQALVPLGSALVSGLTIRFLTWLSPSGDGWTYYSEKTLYLLAGCLIWMIFIPPLQALTTEAGLARTGRVDGAARVAQGAGWALLLLLLMRFSTPLSSPLQRAAAGWNQPSAAVVTETATVADRGKPFLLWAWTDAGNERLGNFWAALTWAYKPDFSAATPYKGTMSDGVPNWAYVEQASSKDICNAAAGVPGLTIVTHEKGLTAGLRKACPGTGATVDLEK